MRKSILEVNIMDHNEYLSIIEGMIFLAGDEGVTIKDVMGG